MPPWIHGDRTETRMVGKCQKERSRRLTRVQSISWKTLLATSMTPWTGVTSGPIQNPLNTRGTRMKSQIGGRCHNVCRQFLDCPQMWKPFWSLAQWRLLQSIWHNPHHKFVFAMALAMLLAYSMDHLFILKDREYSGRQGCGSGQ